MGVRRLEAGSEGKDIIDDKVNEKFGILPLAHALMVVMLRTTISRFTTPMPLIMSVVVMMLLSFEVSAKAQATLEPIENSTASDPFYFLFILIGIALVPFLAVVTTSFTKIVVVLSIARQAIGTAQTPPNIVVMSLAMILTAFSMYPVMLEIYNAIDHKAMVNLKRGEALFEFADKAKEPVRIYLLKHARTEDRELFYTLMNKGDHEKVADVAVNDFIILAPAFLISELSLAFQIGFLIYLPFLVIDMTVANLLMALGMQMLSPTTISLPFKILLFVLVDGWRLLSEGLAKV